MSRDQTPNHGGGNRLIWNDARRVDVEHAVDLALAQAAQDLMRRVVIAKRMAKEHGDPRIKAAGVWHFTQGLCRTLTRNPTYNLSKHCRAALCRILGEEKAQRIEQIARGRALPDNPIGPGPLPMKPPQKPREPDDE